VWEEENTREQQRDFCARAAVEYGPLHLYLLSLIPLTALPHFPLFLIKKQHKTQNTKHKTQNTKHKTQNTKHKTQNTKHKTQNKNTTLPFMCILMLNHEFVVYCFAVACTSLWHHLLCKSSTSNELIVESSLYGEFSL
jgi:hypothetical protein